MALTFVAPHDLRARPFVVPRGHDLHVWNRTPDVGCAVLVDGHRVGDAGPASARLDRARRAALAARHAPRGDVRPPLPAELRQRLSAGASVRSRRTGVRRAPPVYDLHDAATPPDREPRPHSRGGARAGAGPERAQRRDRRGQDDLRAGDRPPARRQGRCGAVGPAASEAYVEAELDVPDGFFDDGELEALAELRPEDEPGLVLARRVFADGRTRAYAWGRAIAREDLAAATERLIAMSGQFEQRRLARPAYQLDVLDAFVGEEQARAATRGARGLARARGGAPAPRRDRPRRRRGRRADRGAARARRAHRGARARARRRRCAPSASACATRPSSPRAPPRATAAVAPDDGDGAASLAAAAERALAPLTAARARARRPRGGAARADRAPERGRQRPAPVRRLARGRSGPAWRRSRRGST